MVKDMSCQRQLYLLSGRITLVLIIAYSTTTVEAGKYEKWLHENLTANYNKMTRPVDNENDSVTIRLGLHLQQIIDVDEKSQVMSTNVWLDLKWMDQSMRWNPADYNNITEIRIATTSIWIPDILLYNSVDENFNTVYQANAIVRHTGHIEWLPPGIVKSTCKINIAWFPFDDQKCSLKFGSWTYGGRFLVLELGDIVRSTYTENGEWKLIDVTAKTTAHYYDCCPDPYYDITFTIWTRRRTLYYGFNLIIPCLLIASMALLDFLLPPEAGEKLTLGITVFMSLCVFLLMVAETMPPTSDAVPLICLYFSTIMIIVSASQVFTVLVINFHYKDPEMHQMPHMIRLVFLRWLPWILAMKRPVYLQSPNLPTPLKQPVTNGALKSSSVSIRLSTTRTKLLDMTNHNNCNRLDPTCRNYPLLHDHGARDHYAPLRQSQFLDCFVPIESLLESIHDQLDIITTKLQEESEEAAQQREWKFAAIVLDRLCLISFSAIFVLAVCAIIFSAPQIVV